MLAYAPLRNKKHIPRFKAAGWRLLLSATSLRKPYPGFKYAIDNGAWTAHNSGTSWSEAKFVTAIKRFGADADWIAAPDIVAGGLESLELTRSWLPRLERFPLVLVPLQDGLDESHIAELVSERVGIFLGGSDEYKLSTMARWGTFSRDVDCYYHVGRVNSQRRVWMCAEAGAHSFDGSSPAIIPEKLARLERARRQSTFVFDG